MCEKNLNITSIENFIQQILLVLLQNSKEALQVNNAVDKNIQIAISQKEDFIYIDVKDWGCGISEHLKL